jgi:acetyl-CoA carboxylase carboxyl transferase subunit beta
MFESAYIPPSDHGAMATASATSQPVTCPGCLAPHERAALERTLWVCPSCHHHLRLTARARLRALVDAQSFVEWDARLSSADPLGFVDRMPYPARARAAQAQTGERDAIVTGRAALLGIPLAIGAFEFGFMGGSMGSVVGEKLFRLFRRAGRAGIPVVVVAASGGARMQEGTLALVQMAKVVVALDRFRRRRLPYVSVLADPITGGVAASVAMLGDVIVAEPGALVGFAGPRVIEQTLRAPLPAGSQRAERLLEHGLIDAVIPRKAMRRYVGDLLQALWRPEAR